MANTNKNTAIVERLHTLAPKTQRIMLMLAVMHERGDLTKLQLDESLPGGITDEFSLARNARLVGKSPTGVSFLRAHGVAAVAWLRGEREQPEALTDLNAALTPKRIRR